MGVRFFSGSGVVGGGSSFFCAGEGVGYPPLVFWTGYHPPSGFCVRASPSVVTPQEATGARLQPEGGGGLSFVRQGGSPLLVWRGGVDLPNSM